MRASLVAGLITVVGCATQQPTPAEAARADTSVRAARAELDAKIAEVSAKYAASEERAEAVGYAVLSDCEAEILVLLDALRRRGRLEVGTSKKASAALAERVGKWDAEAREAVYRDAVASVVRMRGDKAENQR